MRLLLKNIFVSIARRLTNNIFFSLLLNSFSNLIYVKEYFHFYVSISELSKDVQLHDN